MNDVIIMIPAKAASTRLKNKNMQLLGNKPLLQWAIDSAKMAAINADILVSTEDEEIASYAERSGVEALVRPHNLAVDPAGVVDVALHVLNSLNAAGRTYKRIIILLPTCPFRSSEDIQSAYNLFLDKQANFLMSVSAYSHTPFAAMELRDDETLNPYFPEFIGRNSQQMPKAYRANGAIHVLDVCAFMQKKSYYAQPLIGYLMPPERSIDIDTIEDLNYAEFLLEKSSKSKTP